MPVNIWRQQPDYRLTSKDFIRKASLDNSVLIANEFFESLPKLLFTGFIDSVNRKKISPTSESIYWFIRCVDDHYLADKRLAAESYVEKTTGYIVIDLWDKYLRSEGVVLGEVQEGPTVKEVIINYRPVSQALDALAEKSNYIWYIDNYKQLHFTLRSSSKAPFAITPSDIIRDAAMSSQLAETNPLYRNRQFIKAGQDLTDLQTESKKGDGIIVAFPLGYPLGKVPTITVNGVPQTIGIKGLDTGKDVYWNKGDAIITFEVAPVLNATIVCNYYGLYGIMVQVDHTAEQNIRKSIEGGTGLVEVLDTEPEVNRKEDVLALGLAKLLKYGIIGKQFSFPIRKWGIKPGQMITVNYSEYGLSNVEMLTESVDISEFAPGELRYTIKTITGPLIGDWTGFFKRLAEIKYLEERLIVGTDQILIIPVNFSETWSWSEVVTPTVYICPICAPDLYCSPTLLIC